MNKVLLVGRLVRDPDIRYGNNGSTVARLSVAVDRKFKTENGPDADFPSCVAFGKTAEFIEKYFHKGMKIGIEGRIQTGSFTSQTGERTYTCDVLIEGVEFVESKNSSNQSDGYSSSSGSSRSSARPQKVPEDDGFMNIPDGIDEELPFN